MSGDTDVRATGNGRVTRADIEAKLRELESSVTERAEGAKQTAFTVGVVVLAAAVVVSYWLGRRSVRKRRTVLEIRRL